MKKEVVDFPHGNASNQTGRPHIRTCPSVLKSLQDACKHTTTAKAYKVMLLKYRLQQFCSHETQSKWKTSDHAEATFVTWCTLQSPWTGCWLARFCTCDTHTSWSDMHLQQQRTAVMSWIECFCMVQSPTPKLLSYDTTFQLGDFYVSTLAFWHTLFKEAPVIPVAFLIHKEICRHAMISCLAFAASLYPAWRKWRSQYLLMSNRPT